MTTAQEFRDAAGFLRQHRDSEVSEMHDMLLAAAEQAEQLETCRALVLTQSGDLSILKDERDEAWKQIATLTAERDEARAKIDAVKAWLEDYSTTHYVSTAGKFVALKAILSDEAKAAK